MKAWAIGVLTVVLFGAFVGTPVCFAADEDVEVDGVRMILPYAIRGPL